MFWSMLSPIRKKTLPVIHVAVIDDDFGIQRFMGMFIGTAGDKLGIDFKIKYYYSGFDSKQEFEEEGFPDFIFCDYYMPVMDGVELYEWLMENKYKGEFYFMSGAIPDLKKDLEKHDLTDVKTIDKIDQTYKIKEALAAAL